MTCVTWQCDSYHKTAEAAADEFCRTYWAEPRRRGRLGKNGCFRLIGGVADYRVFLNSEARPPVWQIVTIQRQPGY